MSSVVSQTDLAFIAQQDYMHKHNGSIIAADIKEQFIRNDYQRNIHARVTLLQRRLREWMESNTDTNKESFLRVFEIEEERTTIKSITAYVTKCYGSPAIEIVDKLSMRGHYLTLEEDPKIKEYVGNDPGHETKRRHLSIRLIMEKEVRNELVDRSHQPNGLAETDKDEFIPMATLEICKLIGIEKVFEFLNEVDLFFSLIKDSNFKGTLGEFLGKPAVSLFINGYYGPKKDITIEELDIHFRPGGAFRDDAPASCRDYKRRCCYYMSCGGCCLFSSLWLMATIWLGMAWFMSSQTSEFFTLHVKPYFDGVDSETDELGSLVIGIKHLVMVGGFVAGFAFLYFGVPYMYARLPRRIRLSFCRDQSTMEPEEKPCCCGMFTANYALATFAAIGRTRHTQNFLEDLKKSTIAKQHYWMDYDSETELPDINTLYWHKKDSEGLNTLTKTDEIVFKPPKKKPSTKRVTPSREKKYDDISNKV